MLKNRKDTLAKAVKHHYKKQDLFLLEAQKNIERRKNNLDKLNQKLQTLVKATGGTQNESKLERLEEIRREAAGILGRPGTVLGTDELERLRVLLGV